MNRENHETHDRWFGKHVEIQYCNGPYGQTRKVRGIVDWVDAFGGVLLILDSNMAPFTDWPRHLRIPGGIQGKPGMPFYVACGHEVVEKGISEFKDYEHGHTLYKKEI